MEDICLRRRRMVEEMVCRRWRCHVMMPVRGGRDDDVAVAAAAAAAVIVVDDDDDDDDDDACGCTAAGKYKSTSHPNSSFSIEFSSPASIVGVTYM